MGYEFDWSLLPRILPRLGPAIWTTLQLFVLAQILSTAIALSLSVLGNVLRESPLRRGISVYSWLFRGLPELVVLMAFLLIPPTLGLRLTPLTAAVIGLALIASAYEYEVLRGAFTAVPDQQYEAARALGFTGVRMYQRLILPQVLRVAVPPLLTFACTSLKRTSVASAVAVIEVMGTTRRLIDVLQKPFELMLVAMLVYLVLSSVIMTAEVMVRRGWHSTPRSKAVA